MSQKNKAARLWISFLLLPLMLTAMIGCGSKSVSDIPISTVQMSVSASPTTVGVGDISVVEATVTTSGTAVTDEPIWFTVMPTTAGYFVPQRDTTDASGVAATVFHATTAGSVTIYAWVTGNEDPAQASMAIDETSQTGSGNITMSVSPSLLLANGTDSSLVTVTVRTALGSPAPAGTIVRLTAGEKFVDIDGNGYWSTGVDSLVFDANLNGQWDGMGQIPSSATVAGTEGQVTVSFISGNESGTVYISATVDDGEYSGNTEVSLQLSPNAEVASLFLSSDITHLGVKGTGGIETGIIYATAYDIYGNTAPEGIPIDFLITDGPGGGEHLGVVADGYGPYQAMTNGQGVASANIHSGTISGTVRVRATASLSVLANAAQVLISAGPPVYVSVASELCNVPYWDVGCEEVEICAIVSDLYLNPVADNTAVYFTVDEGTMKSHIETTSDLDGIAKGIWFSCQNVATANGRVWVYAETAGGTVMDSVMFFNSHFPLTLTVTGAPATMTADGVSKATLQIAAVDLNDNPVVGGTPFEGDARLISVASGSFEDGCYFSSARTKIVAPLLTIDESVTGANDDGIGAIDLVEYWSGGAASVTFNVTLLTGTAYLPNCPITVQATVAPLEVIPISVTVADRWANPLADHTLILTASDGVVTGGTQETNAYGEAFGFYWTAPNSAGSATLTVTDTDPRGGIILSKTIKVEI